jgi:hypothetical protein
MGNVDSVLPSGIVCDRCNNGILSEIDDALCNFMPIKLRRTLLGTPSKSGKIPELRSSQGTLTFVAGENGADPTLEIRSQSQRKPMATAKELPDGRVELTMAMSGGRLMTAGHTSTISRSLLKAGFELAWLDHGETLLDPTFDHVRDAVLGTPRDGFVAMVRKADPNFTDSVLTYGFLQRDDGEKSIWVWLNYAGVCLATDSRFATLQQPSDELAVVEFTNT